jgi:serine/threonine protein kinase
MDLAVEREQLAVALLQAGVKAAVSALVPGGVVLVKFVEEIAPAFSRAAWAWFSKLSIANRQRALDGLAQMPVGQARQVAEKELHGHNLDLEAAARLATYAASVPMTARRAVWRPDQEARPGTLISQLPFDEASFQRFIPLRPPLFNPGDKVPQHDLMLEELVGQGGFGEVWRARDIYREDAPRIALKFCINIDNLDSLKREVDLVHRLSAKTHHPNIVAIVRTALSAANPFIAYEFVDGGDLVCWLAGYEGKGAPPHYVLRIILMCGRALAHANRHGIVHRDIKPSNILMARDGTVKIADFGIGALSGDPRTKLPALADTVTRLQGASTPLYRDPYWKPGDDPAPRVDFYSLGVIAYQLLLGDVTVGLRSDWRTDLKEIEVPEPIVSLIDRCVAHPSRRFPHADVLVAEVEALRDAGLFEPPSPPPLAINKAALITSVEIQLGGAKAEHTINGLEQASIQLDETRVPVDLSGPREPYERSVTGERTECVTSAQKVSVKNILISVAVAIAVSAGLTYFSYAYDAIYWLSIELFTILQLLSIMIGSACGYAMLFFNTRNLPSSLSKRRSVFIFSLIITCASIIEGGFNALGFNALIVTNGYLFVILLPLTAVTLWSWKQMRAERELARQSEPPVSACALATEQATMHRKQTVINAPAIEQATEEMEQPVALLAILLKRLIPFAWLFIPILTLLAFALFS